MEGNEMKRITIKLKSPNPIFEKWLTEWRDKAKENNSKMQNTFNIALISLQKYPIPLNSGQECMILKGFGKKLCEMLDNRLKIYKENQLNVEANLDYECVENISSKKSKKHKPKKCLNNSKLYVPVYRSGGYAILLTLFKKSQESNYSGFMTKNEIIHDARNYCDQSFIKSDPGSFYTAWSSMSTLISKNLVEKTGSPAKFCLTSEGCAISLKLLDSDESDVDKNNILHSTKGQIKTNSNINNLETNTVASQEETNNELKPVNSNIQTEDDNILSQITAESETILFAPNTFDVILLVDTQETEGKNKNELDDDTKYELNRTGVKYEIRHLKVGDFTWICRHKHTQQELILPYIIERKRLDDLASSIKDGRFHEQKSRLKQCGAKTVIYIIENIGRNVESFGGLPMSTLYQAATNTLVQDCFQVKFTNSHAHTMCYLAKLSGYLIEFYHKKTLMSCLKENLTDYNLSDDLIPLMTFKDFNKSSSKQKDLSIKEMFIKQMVQLKGMSVDKAIAIANRYPTPRLLLDEYDKLDARMRPLLLSKITYGPWKRTIGAVISKTLYQFYTQDMLL